MRERARRWLTTRNASGRGNLAAESEQTAVTVLHDEFARVPGRVGKRSRELDTAARILRVQRVRIVNGQIGVEQLVVVFAGVRCRRFGAAEVDSVLVPRHDRIDRWVLPGADTVESKFVLVVREGGRQVHREE